jgi:hypothetical protein
MRRVRGQRKKFRRCRRPADQIVQRCQTNQMTRNDHAFTLHRMMVELIDDFHAEYPARTGRQAKSIPVKDEVIVATAKTVAELTSRQDGPIRQQLIEQLMREIVKYDAEFRRDDAVSATASHARQ